MNLLGSTKFVRIRNVTFDSCTTEVTTRTLHYIFQYPRQIDP